MSLSFCSFFLQQVFLSFGSGPDGGSLNILLDGCKSGSGFLCVSGPFGLGGHLGYIYTFFSPIFHSFRCYFLFWREAFWNLWGLRWRRSSMNISSWDKLIFHRPLFFLCGDDGVFLFDPDCIYRVCIDMCVCPLLDGASRHLHCRLMVSLYFAVWTESSTGPQKLLNVLIQWNKTKKKKLWRSWKAQQFLSWRMEKSTHIV